MTASEIMQVSCPSSELDSRRLGFPFLLPRDCKVVVARSEVYIKFGLRSLN